MSGMWGGASQSGRLAAAYSTQHSDSYRNRDFTVRSNQRCR